MTIRALNFASLLFPFHLITGHFPCTCSCDCSISKSYSGPCCMCKHELHETVATGLPVVVRGEYRRA